MPVHERGWIEKSRDEVLIKNQNLKALFHKMSTYPKPFFNKRTVWSNLCGKCDRTWHTNTQALGVCLICWLIESSEKSCNGKETKMIHTGFFGHFPYILDIQSSISIFHPSQVLRLSGTHVDTCSVSTILSGTNGPCWPVSSGDGVHACCTSLPWPHAQATA